MGRRLKLGAKAATEDGRFIEKLCFHDHAWAGDGFMTKVPKKKFFKPY